MSDKIIKEYQCEHKKGRIGNKRIITVAIYEDYLYADGYILLQDDYDKKYTSRIEYKEVKDVKPYVVNGDRGVEILVYNNTHKQFVLTDEVFCPGFESSVVTEICEGIKKAKKDFDDRIKIEAEKEKKAKAENAVFFEKCKQFHIGENSDAFFKLKEDEVFMLGMYFNNDNDLNFLKIDGTNRIELCGVIKSEHIHYFEKAGVMHYPEVINVSSKNFGGSFVNNNASELSEYWKDLIFGSMGLKPGQLATAVLDPSAVLGQQLQTSTDTLGIGNESIILNYYSEVKNYFMDIELPAEMYNFLETCLPKKRYEIVKEREKQEELLRQPKPEPVPEPIPVPVPQPIPVPPPEPVPQPIPVPQPVPAPKPIPVPVEPEKKIEPVNPVKKAEDIKEKPVAATGSQTLPLEEFREKIEKIKLLYAADMITAEEFNKHKIKWIARLLGGMSGEGPGELKENIGKVRLLYNTDIISEEEFSECKEKLLSEMLQDIQRQLSLNELREKIDRIKLLYETDMITDEGFEKCKEEILSHLSDSIAGKLSLEKFKERVDKIKLLSDTDMITEEEYNERKTELLSYL